MRWIRREASWSYTPHRIRRSFLLPLWLLFGLPVMITRTVLGAVWSGVGGTAGVTAGVFAALLGIAIAVPVVAFVLGLILALVPLVFLAVVLAAAFAAITWPVRVLFWHGSRRYDRRRLYEDPWDEEERWHG